MASGIAGKVVVVTGAASGIGRAAVRLFADEGASVVAVDVDADALARSITDAPPGVLPVAADVSREDDVDEYMTRAVRRFGRIDGHFLNAGIFGSFAELPDVTLEEFRHVFDVNVGGQFLGMRAAFRQFALQEGAGAIVLTASIASLAGSSDLLAYHASKHATVGLVRAGSVYGGPLGIRVNAVAPGIVPTRLFIADADARGGANDMESRAATTPLRRAGAPREIATVAAFLLADDSSYVTGQVLSADGGASAVNTVRPSGGAGAWDAAAFDASFYRYPRGGAASAHETHDDRIES
ncbi:SDR family NAD(P)-dependent oxidoreductase [Microbacterium ulmi]|uniref:SDR family oxidoreductase n=1 Tax=Microbacterium ulmi TaxID=179095 RepID=A0A7Y2LYI2_9MICO|nr:SDR family NAD(P)-dependent oxidoreductase [Microbacterium ulmi]NII69847.1 NAD(P)-dependent dehydrogenase (short-subunit alcohol dehydrogenase family) [Microbacterium ulmi]NNH03186.1 SDR family oxidoreductase [Microbacterium ulmi]